MHAFCILPLLLALACVPRPDTRPAPLTAPALYEGRLPCEDCGTVLTRLLLEPAGSCLLQEEYRHTWDGHRRYERRGRWREVRGRAGDPDATVYWLHFDAPGLARAFLVIQGGLRLQPLDEEGRPVQSVPPATLVRTGP
jgi:hypothetical protein